VVDSWSRLHEAIRPVADPFVRLRRVVDEALVLAPHADGAAVELLGDDGWTTVVSAGGTLTDSVGTWLPAQGTLSGLAIETATLLRSHDAANDPGVDTETCRRLGVASMLCVPLLRGDHAVGVLRVTATQAGMFTRGDVEVLSAVAGMLSVVVGAVTELGRVAAGLMPGDSERADRASVSVFVSDVLAPHLAEHVAVRDRVREFLDQGQLGIVFQPVLDLSTGSVAGQEALARFPDGRPPDMWFDEANRAGLGTELELLAVAEAMDAVPEDFAGFLAVNLSPAVLVSPKLLVLLDSRPARVDLVLEMTEHEAVADHERTRAGIARLRARGVRVALDDVGSGAAGLRQLVDLRPDIIKIDRSLVSHIDEDAGRHGLAVALTQLAVSMGWTVVAEGIERDEELAACRLIGIKYGQGYLLGRPAPLSAAHSPGHAWITVSEEIFRLNQG
jgi:EAL domain-containing protein (putative c-di-GMP-specific phosphodiesterase class I)